MGVLITIDEHSSKPMFRQIMDQITDRVTAGVLKPGDRLPSTRSMARQLAINRSTIYRAYQELWSRGYLESRPGSYSTVRKRERVVVSPDRPTQGRIEWHRRSPPGTEDLYQAYQRETALFERPADTKTISFVPLSPDSRLFPVEPFRKCMNHVLAARGADLLQYGCPQGYGPLREFIADRMRLHSVDITAEEIMITTGAQSAIELLLKLLVSQKVGAGSPGAGVVFETPTYSRAIDIFRLHPVETIAVPMNADGMDLEALETVLAGQSPAMVYTIPNFHNPTGITTDQGHRERLLHICQRHTVPLVEDGFEEEMKYFGKAVLPVKSMDRDGVVIYLGTFSKVLFPGLRIGWVAAARACIDRLVALQRSAIISGNHLDQAALDRFCRLGHYDLHIKRMHRTYRQRMQTALKAMQTRMDPGQVEWTRPAGGYTIWLWLKDLEIAEKEVMEIIFDCGLMVVPGSFHFHGPADRICLRLSIAHLDEAAIAEGIKRLAGAIRRLY